jgi:phage terminase large subunit
MEIEINLPDLIGRGYASFWHSRKRYRVLKGGRASKKSCNTAHWFIYNIMKHSQANALVIRKTFATHKDSTFAQLKWAALRQHVYHLWHFTTNPLEATYLPTGQKILFRGLDDPLKLTSITVETGVLCWVWIEEAYEIEDEKDFELVDEGIRGELPDGLWKQITLTYNPWVMSHWTKKRFWDQEDPNAFRLTTTYKCNEWLTDEDRRKIEDLNNPKSPTYNPDRYKVVGLGDYGLPGGAYFASWRSDIHVIKPFVIPSHWKRFRSLDYGLDCCSCHDWAIDEQGMEYIVNEVYQPDLIISKAAKEILRVMPKSNNYSYTVASPDLWNREHDLGVPREELFRKAGLTGLIRADNRRVDGWATLAEHLEPFPHPETGKMIAKLRIFETCTHAIRTIPALIRDDVNPNDVSDKCEDHAGEDIRYGAMSRPPITKVNKPVPGQGRKDFHGRGQRTGKTKRKKIDY